VICYTATLRAYINATVTQVHTHPWAEYWVLAPRYYISIYNLLFLFGPLFAFFLDAQAAPKFRLFFNFSFLGANVTVYLLHLFRKVKGFWVAETGINFVPEIQVWSFVCGPVWFLGILCVF
jgi:hypothetical protein